MNTFIENTDKEMVLNRDFNILMNYTSRELALAVQSPRVATILPCDFLIFAIYSSFMIYIFYLD
jgi:hypothetical protein